MKIEQLAKRSSETPDKKSSLIKKIKQLTEKLGRLIIEY